MSYSALTRAVRPGVRLARGNSKEVFWVQLAEEFARSLQTMGVRYVFGIPGGPSIAFMDAIRRQGMEFILVSHEEAAGVMADVTGRLTGVPGVCHATFGPGATHLATGVGGALLDRSPLIAFTTEVRPEDLDRKVQMNIDHQALFRPLTKWTTRLTEDNLTETMTKAYQVATAEVTGPVHIGVPSNLDTAAAEPPEGGYRFEKSAGGDPSPVALEQAFSLMSKARRPIVALGLTAARRGCSAAIRRWIEKSRIPVVVTPMAKGVVPESHPCYAGALFHALSDRVADIYRQADLVIGLGYDPIEFNYEQWMPKVPLVHIDTSKADITPDYDVACEVVGDLVPALEYLNARTWPVYQWDMAEIGENRKKVMDGLFPASTGFTPSQAIAVLQEVLPGDGILTADVGAHLHLLGQLWRSGEPNKLLMTNGWSSMGWGLPAALGAKLSRPEKTVVCVTGDGGFLMNCGELMTARRYGINTVTVVLCDHSLSLIEVKQERKNVPAYATRLYKDDYFNAGSFLGVPVLRARDPGELKAALLSAFAANGPVIIEATVDGASYTDLIARSYK